MYEISKIEWPLTAPVPLGSWYLRTSDLYRVNFEVNNLKPFACLAFPQTTYLKTPRKQAIFGDELVTSLPVHVPRSVRDSNLGNLRPATPASAQFLC
jgi:hypothetical protein